jgi:hypothetical protein
VRELPIKERFAAFPTYNHPLLMNGRKVVLGYGGHLWTQGFDYAPIERQLQALMLGAPDWRERARALHARYLFWGREEERAYAQVRSLGAGRRRSLRKAFGAQFTTLSGRPAGAPSNGDRSLGNACERSKIICCNDAFCAT